MTDERDLAADGSRPLPDEVREALGWDPPQSSTGHRANRLLYVGTFPDGSQLMVERWLDENDDEVEVTAATRPVADRSVVWGPPIRLEPE
jgi:hypothetical protein